GFDRFSKALGLKANNSKTKVYACGIDEEELQELLGKSGYKKGKIPFKYLGVPICSRWIGISQCERMVEAMTSRIRAWSSRHLLFAGKSQSINSVLLSTHHYLAQVFVLPITVLTDIERVCRAYLWSDEWYYACLGYISWEDVRRRKTEGVLGIQEYTKVEHCKHGLTCLSFG
ncbi:hypothetical protein RDABS01_039928, partial [Bienertia sinuspersici]